MKSVVKAEKLQKQCATTHTQKYLRAHISGLPNFTCIYIPRSFLQGRPLYYSVIYAELYYSVT